MAYNGWANRETWLVVCWFAPESREDVEAAQYTIEEAWDALPDFMRDFCDIESIDWEEIFQHFAEEEEVEEE